MVTLGLYLLSTVATAFSFAPWWFFVFRGLTGMGIGSEYAAINSAIDELIPARNRGRVDVSINGSYYVGAASADWGRSCWSTPRSLRWRLAFGIGAILGLAILLVRGQLPESDSVALTDVRVDGELDVVLEIPRAPDRNLGAADGVEVLASTRPGLPHR